MEQDKEKLTNDSEKIVKRNEKGQLLPGSVLNPIGKLPGTKNFDTDWDEAVGEIAKENNMTLSEANKLLIKVAYKNAKDGVFQYHKDIHDRRYGQATQKSEASVNLNVKSIDPTDPEILEALKTINKQRANEQ